MGCGRGLMEVSGKLVRECSECLSLVHIPIASLCVLEMFA